MYEEPYSFIIRGSAGYVSITPTQNAAFFSSALQHLLSVNIRAKCDSFQGAFSDEIQIYDVSELLDMCRRLQDNLNGEEEMFFQEAWGAIHAKMTSGKLTWSIELQKIHGHGPKLTFDLESDQSYLPEIILQLEKLELYMKGKVA